MLGSALTGIGAGLGDLFGGYQNPANAAMPYLNNIQQQLPGYFQPYMQAGQNALGPLQQQYSSLMSNPAGMMNQIGAGYHQSPGYQFQLQQGENASNQAAAAGGMGGTPMAQYNSGQFASGLANQDYYNYMKQALGQYGMGLQGEQGLAGLGYQASSGLGEDMATLAGAQAQLAYSGQQNQNEQQGGGWGSLLGGLGSLIGGGGFGSGGSGIGNAVSSVWNAF